MSKVRFGDIVTDVKNKVDRNNNPYEFYVAGDHMDTEDLVIHRKGKFATDDVGPAFIREFKAGQILYGSRRTYLKKVAVADFDGVTANTTFVLETSDETKFLQELLPFVMLSDGFTQWSIMKSKGSTNPYVLFSDLADYEFDLPDIGKQRELANVLWAMDATKRSYKNLRMKTEELVKSKFIEMFYGEKYTMVPLSTMVDKRIKKIKSISDEFEAIRYIDISSIDNTTQRVTSYTEFSISDAPSRAQQVLEQGDILVSTVRPNLRNIAVNPYSESNVVASTGFCILRSNKEYLPEYLWGIVNSDKFTKTMCENATGISYPAVRDKDVLNYTAPKAPLVLQKKFSNFVRQSDKSKLELEQALAELTATYKKIISENLG